jgi:hypothetical protein
MCKSLPRRRNEKNGQPHAHAATLAAASLHPPLKRCLPMTDH